MFQTKEWDKTSETDLNEKEVNDLYDKEFKIMVIKMLTEVRRTMHEWGETFNKETENIRQYQTEIKELNNTTTKLKSSIEGFNKRLVEGSIGELKDMTVEFIQSEEQKEKRIKKSKDNLRDLWDTSRGATFALQESQEKREKELSQRNNGWKHS